MRKFIQFPFPFPLSPLPLIQLKDLRSQITREACITISYLSTVLGSGFAHFAEAVIPQLIILLPNSAKVMASSAEVCVKFIMKVSGKVEPGIIAVVLSSLYIGIT